MNATRSLRQDLLRLAPYGAAALVLLGLMRSGITESIDLLVYDAVTTLRPAPSAKDLPITIIGIDEGDIDRYGWPIDDTILCRAIERAAAAHATAIGVDLYRDKGIGPNADCLPQLARREPRLITIFNGAEGIEPVPGAPAERQAFNDLLVDPDGVVRRQLVHVSGQNAATVSLSLRLVEVASGNSRWRQTFKDATATEQLGPWLQQGSGGYQQLDAGGYQRLLPFLRRGSFKQLSLRNLADGPSANIATAIRGRIVLIGSTAPSLKDQFDTPHSRFAKGSRDLRMSGVELHAMSTAALMQPTGTPWPLTTMPAAIEQALELSLILAGAALGAAFSSFRRGVLSVLSLVSVTGLLAVASLWWLGLWVGVTTPVLGILLMAAVGWLRRGAISQLQRQQFQRLLGQTTSPAVAAQLWEQRDQLLADGRFEGRQLFVTVLFSDTCSFTTVSEQLAPAELLNWLNRGMAQLVPAVTRRGGMVNKFTGDGMLAVFGAPVSHGAREDAEAAIEAALDIQSALGRLNVELMQEGAPPMRMRIGIHSGAVLAGSMGSMERLEYAVIGDAVNCASRLESLDKTRQDNDCRVLVSASTRENLLDESLIWRDWGSLQVKGRRKPLCISELRGRREDGESIRMGNEPATGTAIDH